MQNTRCLNHLCRHIVSWCCISCIGYQSSNKGPIYLELPLPICLPKNTMLRLRSDMAFGMAGKWAQTAHQIIYLIFSQRVNWNNAFVWGSNVHLLSVSPLLPLQLNFIAGAGGTVHSHWPVTWTLHVSTYIMGILSPSIDWLVTANFNYCFTTFMNISFVVIHSESTWGAGWDTNPPPKLNKSLSTIHYCHCIPFLPPTSHCPALL